MFHLCSQEQCTAMVDLTRDFQNMKSSISAILDNAESVAEMKVAVKDQDDIRRALSRVSLGLQSCS